VVVDGPPPSSKRLSEFSWTNKGSTNTPYENKNEGSKYFEM